MENNILEMLDYIRNYQPNDIRENKIINQDDDFFKKHKLAINNLNLSISVDFKDIVVSNNSIMWKIDLTKDAQIVANFFDNKINIYLKSSKLSLDGNVTSSIHKLTNYLIEVYAKDLKDNYNV